MDGMSGEKDLRKSRFKRSGDPGRLALQPRDEVILTLVSQFRLLSREQLQRLLDFPCVTRINIRLRKLFDNGYLSRRFLPTLRGSPKTLYFLGAKGIEIVSESLGVGPIGLEKERKNISEGKGLFLNHQLSLNEVRMSFILAIKNNPQIALERWLSEKDCSIEIRSATGRRALRPDGFFCFSFQRRRYSFFLEVDCSTMSNGRIKSKVMAYLEYARSGLYEQDFGLRYFRVLFITKTQARLLNLKSTIEKVTHRVFYLSTLDNLSRNPIRDRIWVWAGRSSLSSLLEG
jgi:hypothetical protein